MLSRTLQTLSLAELQTERSACLSALFKLARGETTQRVGFDGRAVDYTPADTAKLEALIGELDRAIRAKESGRTPNRRPLHPVY
ncbi:gpW family head-tail joining protein [Thiocystis violacea]|uniref:gpW family head-tail joining protein n=1 Tax=Thiocystis violacea TaxID=13725 RepID=UPI00190300D6|nr:gpW family head-tail joining protein [Thiocystis violacea]MBK1719218.1 hypothetical protein [Thiocystis violacea]